MENISINFDKFPDSWTKVIRETMSQEHTRKLILYIYGLTEKDFVEMQCTKSNLNIEESKIETNYHTMFLQAKYRF